MNVAAVDIERAADAVRTANHSTARGRLDGPQAYTAVGNLVELVERLPQLFEFVAASLRDTHAEQHYDDRGHDPADALTAACGAVLNAHHWLGPLLDRLADAHNHLGHLGRRIQED